MMEGEATGIDSRFLYYTLTENRYSMPNTTCGGNENLRDYSLISPNAAFSPECLVLF